MKKIYVIIIIILVILILLFVGVSKMVLFGESKRKLINSLKEGVEESIIVSTNSFEKNGYIPVKYTCDGSDISPEIEWKNIPDNTKSIMIVVYDPDAPSDYFIHWIIYNIPPNITSLPEGESGRSKRSGIGLEALNDFGKVGYGGPCPPPGKPHRYYFLVLALDTSLKIEGRVRATDVLKEVRGHIIAYGELMGKYSR